MVLLTEHGQTLGLIILVHHMLLSDDQRVELYAIGAPQSHGQNLYKQNIATYSQELAGSIDGYDDSAYVAGNKFEH